MRALPYVFALILVLTMATAPAFAQSGPRTSPFDPPEPDDHSFVTDDAPKLDTGCIFSSLGPIEFDIEVTRHVGPVDGNGTLQNASDLVAAGLLSDTATLIIPAFDVDSNASPPAPFLPEQDRVLFNGEEIGFLSGENNTWKLNSFDIDIDKVKFPARGSGGAPSPAINTVTIEIDVGNAPTQVWCTSADWGSTDFKAMSPIILIHGNGSDGGFFDRRGFAGELQNRHLLFDNSISMPTTTVAANGRNLEGSIPGIVESFGVDSVHLVAHSKGGLDSREYLATFQPGHDDDFEVLSYSTLSTPHNGSLLADVLILRDRAAAAAQETEFENFPAFSQTVINQIPTDAGTPNLTTAFTASFNSGNLPNIDGSIVFNTIAADADTNGNGRIDNNPDEYADLRAESPDLQNLFNTRVVGPTIARRGVDIPYQVLRNNQSITMRLVRRRRFMGLGGTRTVAIITANAAPEPVGNDVLVTIPSGRGEGSIRGRVRNSHEFVGAAGRNHSSVANGGVAATVAPWLVDIERQNGDLQ